jgi:hypothetical protein
MLAPVVVRYQFLADAVLVFHFAIVLFVVAGPIVVVAGNWLRWHWVNQPWFRVAHLAATGVIVVQAWLGRLCPLTTLESWLRVKAGADAYAKSFIQHWIQRVLFYEAPSWVFTVAYTVFGILVLLTWWRFPPRRGPRIEVDAARATGRTPAS